MTRVLFIAPLPPPVTGHSLASQVLLDALKDGCEVDAVDLSTASGHDGRISARRVAAVATALFQVWRYRARADVIYLTIAESVAGNLKDLIIYALCAGRLSNMCLHLHGGSIGPLLFAKYPLLRMLNAVALRRVEAVVVTGASHRATFAQMVEPKKIHVVPNFAADDLFVDEELIRAKFALSMPLRVAYLSAMTAAKGCHALLEAYEMLDDSAKTMVTIDFAGAFASDDDKRLFEKRIAGRQGVRYHGEVHGEQKRMLLSRAHVLCLPTVMREGQPIVILEAYASGCVVITTGQPGIRDVFRGGENGIELPSSDPRAIADAIGSCARLGSALTDVAVSNWRQASDAHRRERFTREMGSVIRRCALG